MRTFHWNTPIIIGAGAFLLSVLALAPLALEAGEPVKTASVEATASAGISSVDSAPVETGWVTTVSVETGAVVINTESSKRLQDFAELRSHLDGSDRALALNALQVALTELGDGVPLVWKRESRGLTGVIKPVSAFRDDSGRICRRLTYSLSLGTYVKEVEGIACRDADGKWSLQG